MRSRHRRAASTLALLALAGCDSVRPSLADADAPASLCSPVPEQRQDRAANAYQQAVQRDECVHRNAYALAAAPDPADAVVGAVVAACRTEIDRSATLLSQGDPEAERWYLAEMERAARERALFRVVQARAGRCS